MKIKVIEKPMINFGTEEKLSKNEMNGLKGGKCLIWFQKFVIGPTCVCVKKNFLACFEEMDTMDLACLEEMHTIDII